MDDSTSDFLLLVMSCDISPLGGLRLDIINGQPCSVFVLSSHIFITFIVKVVVPIVEILDVEQFHQSSIVKIILKNEVVNFFC